MLRDLVPYDKQADPRWCGAAALRMVYLSLGIDEAQLDIWARITHPNAERARAAGSYRLAQDALARQLHAMVIRALKPWPILEQCVQHSIRAILNHCPRPRGSSGHFSVLLDLTPEEVVLHDPMAGPEQRLPRAQFESMWSRAGTGQVLIAVTAADTAGPVASVCAACARPIPHQQECRGCKTVVPLQPAALLGCWYARCDERIWDRIFCPKCDASIFPDYPPRDKKIE